MNTSTTARDENTCQKSGQPACPVCGGELIDIRAKLVCSQCHQICETCCEGGRTPSRT